MVSLSLFLFSNNVGKSFSISLSSVGRNVLSYSEIIFTIVFLICVQLNSYMQSRMTTKDSFYLICYFLVITGNKMTFLLQRSKSTAKTQSNLCI